MDITAHECRTEFGKELFGFTSRPQRVRCDGVGFATTPSRTKMSGNYQMWWRMVDPISGQLLDVEERHCIDYRISVSTSCGEEAIDLSPVAAALALSPPSCVRGPRIPPA